MPPTVRLPRPDGTLERYVMREAVAWPAPAGPIHSRVASYFHARCICSHTLGSGVTLIHLYERGLPT